MPDRKKRILHFAELNHGQRVAAARYLGNKPIRAINVISNKTCLQKDVFTEKNQLYFYLTRYLIERVSWLCRDMRPLVPEGDGRVKIIFSRRGGLSYDNFKEYMTHLTSAVDNEVRIHWPVIDIGAIEAREHSKSASLQIADIVASSFANAFEQDRYGNSEWRYAELLKRIVYNRKNNFLSYGMKFHPSIKDLQLSDEQKRAITLFERDGRPPGP